MAPQGAGEERTDCIGLYRETPPESGVFPFQVKKVSLHWSLVAKQARAYPGFRSMKQQDYFYSPLDGMLVHHRVTPSGKFAGAHLYTWVERGTMRVKYLAQEHKAGQGLNPDCSIQSPAHLPLGSLRVAVPAPEQKPKSERKSAFPQGVGTAKRRLGIGPLHLTQAGSNRGGGGGGGGGGISPLLPRKHNSQSFTLT